jgi:hypothetical protein
VESFTIILLHFDLDDNFKVGRLMDAPIYVDVTRPACLLLCIRFPCVRFVVSQWF